MTADEIAERLDSMIAAFRDDTATRERQWAEERAETEARHKAEVARVQSNTLETRALHVRSVEASEDLATAMDRIAAVLERGR